MIHVRHPHDLATGTPHDRALPAPTLGRRLRRRWADEHKRRLAGLTASLAAIAVGAGAWLGGVPGAAHDLAVAAFLAGHLGLLATLTFTSSGPTTEEWEDRLGALQPERPTVALARVAVIDVDQVEPADAVAGVDRDGVDELGAGAPPILVRAS